MRAPRRGRPWATFLVKSGQSSHACRPQYRSLGPALDTNVRARTHPPWSPLTEDGRRKEQRAEPRRADRGGPVQLRRTLLGIRPALDINVRMHGTRCSRKSELERAKPTALVTARSNQATALHRHSRTSRRALDGQREPQRQTKQRISVSRYARRRELSPSGVKPIRTGCAYTSGKDGNRTRPRFGVTDDRVVSCRSRERETEGSSFACSEPRWRPRTPAALVGPLCLAR